MLSPEEVARLLQAAPGLKYKAALSVAYGAGLRVSEVANLKVSDIDSERMMLRVEQGKGQRDRDVMLSPQLLQLLREWWKAARPQVWLFPGQNPINPVTPRQLNRAVTAAKDLAGISKRVSPHTLRHSFATHLLEQGVDIRVIQVLLGHAKLETTALYTRVAVSTVRDIKSPLDRLGVELTSERRPPDQSRVPRPPLEVADVFRAHGAAWRKANAGHVSLAQLKVMSAIETCRTAALGGHVERCEDCAHERIAYNSCRNRHCPKCQAAAARQWLEDREAELLPVPYYHVVFTLPASIGAIAFQNKAAVYDLLFRSAAETLTTIAADPKHLGARIGLTAVLHTWGSALTHHPHVHVIVPGGGLSPDGSRWIACKRGFFLPVRVLSRLFRRLFLEGLAALHAAGRLVFFGDLAPLDDKAAFDAALAPLRRSEWVVYAKRPFAGPKAVLAYLSRYTHRVAISNSRLIRLDDDGVTFRWKDYRARGKAPARPGSRPMTLAAGEFIRRFLLHVLPSGFHRIRHYGFLAGPGRAATIGRLRDLIAASDATARPRPETDQAAPRPPPNPPRRKTWPGSVLAAAVACASSRRSPVALVLAASPPNPPESTLHDRRSGPRRHRPPLAEDLPWRRSVRARADGGDQRRPPPRLRNARLCRSADPRPVRRPPVIRKSATAAVPRGAAKRQIPIARPRRRTLTVPRFPPLEAFGRRPSGPHLRPRQGRHPKPYKIPAIHRGLCQLIISAPLRPFPAGTGTRRGRPEPRTCQPDPACSVRPKAQRSSQSNRTI